MVQRMFKIYPNVIRNNEGRSLMFNGDLMGDSMVNPPKLGYNLYISNDLFGHVSGSTCNKLGPEVCFGSGGQDL